MTRKTKPNLKKLVDEGFEFKFTMHGVLDIYEMPNQSERAIYDSEKDYVVQKYNFDRARLANRNGGVRK